MALRRFVIEVGMGVDQHGQDNIRAAEKALQVPGLEFRILEELVLCQ